MTRNSIRLQHQVNLTLKRPSSAYNRSQSHRAFALSQRQNLGQQSDAEVDEALWRKKKAEMEELMISLISDLNFRLEAATNLSQDKEMEQERLFYLEKLLRIEALLKENDSEVANLIKEVLEEDSEILKTNPRIKY